MMKIKQIIATSVLITMATYANAQDTKFGIPVFVSDSLVIENGVANNQFDFPVTGRDVLVSYQSFGVVSANSKADKIIFHHWEQPVKVYLDQSLPSYLKRDFRKFIKMFPKIENLSISVVSNIRDANYKIQRTKDSLMLSPEKSVYNGATYGLIADELGNCTTAILRINTENAKDSKLHKKQLRMFFFNSLGRFNFKSPSHGQETTLFSKRYELQDKISDFDLKMLRCHYLLVNKNTLNPRKFEALFDKFMQLPDDQKTGKTVKLKI